MATTQNQIGETVSMRPAPTSFSLKSMIIVVTTICLVVGVIGLLAREAKKAKERFRCQYALWQVADMISLHINQTSSLPESWNDLIQEFRFTNDSYGTFTFEELESNVSIDFQLLRATFESDSICASEKFEGQEFFRWKSFQEKNVLVKAEIDANIRVYESLCHLKKALAR